MQEKDYCRDITFPHTRLRFYVATSKGDVEMFLVQLEYNLNPDFIERDQWVAVARFDHNPYSFDGHDVRQEELHLDLLDPDGTKHDVRRGFPCIPHPLALNKVPDYCEDYLLRNTRTLIADFEKRNGLDGLYYPP